MTRYLPDISNEEQLGRVYRDADAWLPAVTEIARRHDLESGDWKRADSGSHVAMVGDDVVVKLYVPFWPEMVEVESAALRLVAGRVDIAVPIELGRGRLEGWDYQVQRRVPGVPLAEVRGALDRSDEIAIASALGELIRQLHDIEVPPDSILLDVVSDWGAFLEDHHSRRQELELERGTSPEWAARLVDYLSGWRYEPRRTDCLLHADLHHHHILVAPTNEGWRLSGIIDFGDAKVGDAAYEFATPFAFWTGGRPDLRAAMLRAYGDFDAAFLERVFENLLLHEFGRLSLLELDGLSTVRAVKEKYVEVITGST